MSRACAAAVVASLAGLLLLALRGVVAVVLSADGESGDVRSVSASVLLLCCWSCSACEVSELVSSRCFCCLSCTASLLMTRFSRL